MQKAFTDEHNREVFGACYDPYGHGHDYVLEAFLEGEIDPHDKWVSDLAKVDLMLREVCKHLDHHHLNFSVPYFRNRVPTTENLANYLYRLLQTEVKMRMPETKLQRVRLFETDDIWVEVRT